tara:strand:- start:7798 stop:8067 length:270 start_codon:yes stop_codon:yes gene_type:complete
MDELKLSRDALTRAIELSPRDLAEELHHAKREIGRLMSSGKRGYFEYKLPLEILSVARHNDMSPAVETLVDKASDALDRIIEPYVWPDK